MTTKNTSSRIILKENSILDLNELEIMVKEFINNCYGSKKMVRKLVRTEFGSSFKLKKITKTLHSVFNEFKRLDNKSSNSFRKLFRYLDKNYNSTHKLRDIHIFKLKYDGYTFTEIVKISGLSIARVKQVYYEIKNLIKIKNLIY